MNSISLGKIPAITNCFFVVLFIDKKPLLFKPSKLKRLHSFLYVEINALRNIPLIVNLLFKAFH